MLNVFAQLKTSAFFQKHSGLRLTHFPTELRKKTAYSRFEQTISALSCCLHSEQHGIFIENNCENTLTQYGKERGFYIYSQELFTVTLFLYEPISARPLFLAVPRTSVPIARGHFSLQVTLSLENVDNE